ncbi:MAG: prepilin-type N-terminal cleavage/methylation domain-containing protein [Planctomycetota bacterium]|nr:prepilin-type N-terminal cleavage/methylation domain-containing protein [Planctomycetota bacterium]
MITVAQKRSRAFTLLESLLAVVVLAMAVTAIIMPFTAAATNQQVDARRSLAVGLAQEIMEEILTKPFHDPQGSSSLGPEIGETSRTLFDNIDDYHGYTEDPGGICSFDGAIIDEPESVGLSREVTAGYIYVSGQDVSEDPTFIRVVVEVKYSDQPLVTLTRLVYALD